MEYRNLGDTDLKASVIALGGNTFGPPRLDETQSIRTIHAADDLGVNFVDTADLYGGGYSETFIGRALASRRERWIIATKFNLRNLAGANVADYIISACENSLRKLNTDHIDLYQLHMPTSIRRKMKYFVHWISSFALAKCVRSAPPIINHGILRVVIT